MWKNDEFCCKYCNFKNLSNLVFYEPCKPKYNYRTTNFQKLLQLPYERNQTISGKSTDKNKKTLSQIMRKLLTPHPHPHQKIAHALKKYFVTVETYLSKDIPETTQKYTGNYLPL